MTGQAICGLKNGTATHIRSLESCAIFIHCNGHGLKLAIGDTKYFVKLLTPHKKFQNCYSIPREEMHFLRN